MAKLVLAAMVELGVKIVMVIVELMAKLVSLVQVVEEALVVELVEVEAVDFS